MRLLIVLAGLIPVLAGCGQSEQAADQTAENYRPPTVTSRLDYGGQIERRFHRLDKNSDDKLSVDELPDRLKAELPKYDKDGDGSLNSQEWGALMLDRFDQRDLDKDGSLTTSERQASRGTPATAAR